MEFQIDFIYQVRCEERIRSLVAQLAARQAMNLFVNGGEVLIVSVIFLIDGVAPRDDMEESSLPGSS